MIKFENTEVFNFEGALRGMRNPFNSWDKSDSCFCHNHSSYEGHEDTCESIEIGKNDLGLAQKLIKGGTDDRKFLRQIFISVDITAPLYWWKEFDTYKVGTVANSCSTMHTIHTKRFTRDDFSHEHLDQFSLEALDRVISVLNICRSDYLENNSDRYEAMGTTRKDDWWQMIQLLPSSYNQRRTVTLSYENARAIRHSDRRNHKLDEWRVGFMNWLDSLPYAEELIIT